MSSTLETVIDIIHKESGWPTSILTPDKTYGALDLDSLALLTIFVNLEDEFKVKLEGEEDVPRLPENTLQDLVNFIDTKIGK